MGFYRFIQLKLNILNYHKVTFTKEYQQKPAENLFFTTLFKIMIKRNQAMTMTKNGLINVSNQLADCTISLFGANLVSYRPKTQQQDVFWLGDLNKFDNTQAIRGGIPVCWPRVAEEALNNHLPRHGFARLSTWDLKSILVDETKIKAELCLIPDPKYDLNVTASLFIKVTDKLEYTLETANNSDQVFEFSEALHAYFNVGSIDDVEITGLSNQTYKNSLDGQIYTQKDNIKIKGEIDSIFTHHTGSIEIKDKTLNRIISIHKTGSNCTVVWNPNKDLAEMSAEQYKKFVCVEPSNQGEAFVRLQPGEKHRISMTIQVKN